ncbi:hypothetical protein D1006_01360 [Burkholderia stabilis]|uniref:Uncharacterized protein n=3 Tax=Burkholderia TaxID=32008 RepID=A0A4V1PSH9_9BURK|nr:MULTISPECIES: hypothetical protein [Burkholderia]KML53951.1 hypothetical protein VL15_22370 [Burkholderia cepacia]RXV71154.1 hypothetical protein D1006_01360 [Burkholderia stabilis]
MSQYDKDDVLDAAKRIEENRLGIVLSGHIKNGKLVLDQETLDAIAAKFPNADRAFVALNAPFDPCSQSL